MAHHKHLGSFIVVAVLVYLAVRYWESTHGGAGAPGAKPGASLLSILGLNPANVADGSPGNPNFATGIGGSGVGFDGASGVGWSNAGNAGNLFHGPGYRSAFGEPDYLSNDAGRSGGFGGGAIEQGNAQGGGNIGGVPNSFGNCSTNPRDGKLVCV